MQTHDGSGPATFDLSRLGQLLQTPEFRVNTVRLAQFAAAIGDENPAHLAGTVASPIFANVPPMQCAIQTLRQVTPAFAFHGQHDFHYHRPIRPGMRLFCRASLWGAAPSPAGVSIVVKSETRDQDGALVDEQYLSALVAGGALAQAVGRAAPEHRLPDAAKRQAPVAEVTSAMAPDQTVLYADAARDYSPYTLRRDAAMSMGFPDLVVHGMLTQAFAGRAVVDTVCGGDSTRLKRFACRFSAPVYLVPGQSITTKIWLLETRREIRTFGYEASDTTEHVVIKHGLAEVAS
jgi:acyl dehydratase